jgi:hypothetical protein
VLVLESHEEALEVGVEELEGTLLRVPENVCTAEKDCVAQGVEVTETVDVGEPVNEFLAVPLFTAELLALGVALRVKEGLAVVLELAVDDTVPVNKADAEAVTDVVAVKVYVGVPVSVLDGTADPVPEIVEQIVTEKEPDGVIEEVEDELAEEPPDAVCEGEKVSVAELENVARGEEEEVDDVLALAVGVPVSDASAEADA